MPPPTVHTWRGNQASWAGRLAPPLCTGLGVLLPESLTMESIFFMRGRAPSSPTFKLVRLLSCTTARLGKSTPELGAWGWVSRRLACPASGGSLWSLSLP